MFILLIVIRTKDKVHFYFIFFFIEPINVVTGEICVADTDTNLKMVEANKEITYAFRFSTSDKFFRLTQQQLDSIPYLSALVTHKDDFSSTHNEDKKLVVNPSINYNWFMVIFDSIISNQPYTLFNNKLLEDGNILDILKLFDYLGVESFSSPLLKDKHLNSIYHVNQEEVLPIIVQILQKHETRLQNLL